MGFSIFFLCPPASGRKAHGELDLGQKGISQFLRSKDHFGNILEKTDFHIFEANITEKKMKKKMNPKLWNKKRSTKKINQSKFKKQIIELLHFENDLFG